MPQIKKGDVVYYVCKYDIYGENPTVLPAVVTKVSSSNPEELFLNAQTIGGGFSKAKPTPHDENKAPGTWHYKE